MKLVFMGSPDFAVSSLGALISSKHEVSLVVTQPDKPAGRGRKLTPSPVAEFAKEHDIPTEKPLTLKDNNELLFKIKTLAPDAIIVVAYGKIIPKEILDLPLKGCINVHASLLPKYRGAAPINWAIMNGEQKTGVTTMYMNKKMDEGDILLQCATEITSHDTSETLHEHLAAMGAELLLKTLDRIEAGTLAGLVQDHKEATVFHKLSKEEGLIDWGRSASGIYNRIRGLTPWPGAYTYTEEAGSKKQEARNDKNKLIIYDAAPIEIETKERPGTIIGLDKGIFVATGFGQLCILEVQAPGKKRMPAVEYLKGSGLKVGDRFI
ncbi:MAG: methionyl-tRNA formyltransferase [Deltaproteobacteria bacterium CG11_big_fil_rev_8_21_14_0_20_49_13]|nr:MAG: methionyl-tRNA formyltransferase [Deltaproteobacteria bacterium CG11_big_fil_rev_8_21_14_0_20_49_13]